MCQPKSKGGKRCLKHAKLSQFVTRYVKVKTGARDELISETMGELNREAKANNVAPASSSDVAAFIDKQSLAVDVDQNINSHDRKIMQNQLTAAREETSTGADGNHFYAWKNLLGRVRSKMRKAVLAFGLAGTLAVGISGCAAGVTPNVTTTPTPSFSTSAPATQSPTAAPVKLGEAVGTGVIVKDSHGSYETTKLDPNDEAYKYDANSVDKSATSRFNKSDILSAQKYVVDFVSTQGVDSVALDNDDAGWNQWKNTEADKYILPAAKSVILKDMNAENRSGIILNDNRNATPTFVRDGKPRIANEKLSVSTITGGTAAPYGDYLVVSGTDTVTYRVTKAEVIKTILKSNKGLTEAKLKETYPNLYNASAPDPQEKAVFTFEYGVLKHGDSWQIGSYNNQSNFSLINLK